MNLYSLKQHIGQPSFEETGMIKNEYLRSYECHLERLQKSLNHIENLNKPEMNPNDRDGKRKASGEDEKKRKKPPVPSRDGAAPSNEASSSKKPPRMPIRSEQERKERKRKQNTASARRCRARNKEESKEFEKTLENVFDANDRRMDVLESVVKELEEELATPSSSGSSSRDDSKKKGFRK